MFKEFFSMLLCIRYGMQAFYPFIYIHVGFVYKIVQGIGLVISLDLVLFKFTSLIE
jgi:hypothetical protein